MRSSPTVLSPLFGDLMLRILSATVLQPQREWYLSDLAGELGVRPSSLQRPLAGLAEAGILRRRKDGNRVYFSADTGCVIYVELARLLGKGRDAVDDGADGRDWGREMPEKLAVDL